ncbi:hypothetical protein Z042_14980 [Chania multitudinisentens RB-25]|uniref:YdgH/BhsA/McbA-like domain-containing protein n=1 Tax=Chania multitudinisentens RB-25 TaxID=1441930 RepID=W0LA99_9GAMM|nr:DUF1471 domain-containing protein [Chania multitudinisentens]AHG20763.1 hypothetical protein Z042_14980 [Chania multitudinisentens RB-25]
MKPITIATAIALLLSAHAMAATEITSHQAEQRQSIGFVTLDQDVVSPDDATSQISRIADQRGASAYHIIALHEPGSTDSFHVSAELYR